MAKLGLGGAASRDEQREFAREAFLNAAARLYPKMIDDLHRAEPSQVGAWAREWHIDAPWVRRIASFTLTLWLADVLDEDHEFFVPVQRFEESTPSGSELTLFWSPELQSESDFDSEVKARVREYKKLRQAETRSQYHRGRVKAKSDDHFLWLAEYQIGQIAATDIARRLLGQNTRRYDLDRKSDYVTGIISELAKSISLPRRRGRKGRPRSKSSDR